MVEIRKPITVQEAVSKVMAHMPLMPAETVSIDDCDRRVLAEDIYADHDVPPFNRSPYDGFAIIAEDTNDASRENPVTLKVIEEIGAGDVAGQAVGHGQAIRIMTGAALPEGADAIVMLEVVHEKNNGKEIEIKRRIKTFDNISWKGEDTEKGTLLLEKGRQVTPGVKAVLATFGYAKVKVYQQPVIGIIATGSELLDVSEPLVPGKIRNSNAHMMISQVKEAGGIPEYFGQLKDDFDHSFRAVKAALAEVDILITTGGVSVGDFDYLPDIYKKLGAEVLFNKVGMRPGSVTTVAYLPDSGQLLFGLSGNPSSCFVGFELFAGPLIKGCQGLKNRFLSLAEATLTHDFPKPNPFHRFVRSRAAFTNGQWQSSPVGLDKSNVVTSLAEANALMVLPGGTRGYKSGDQVNVLLLNSEGREHFCL
ncbi:molybdopterin molybdotransferase [Scopulibacillus daqui]|uniref:Molybdopterin molybdenumtransferase n=1 Tax=Scopulibacillus daqui TaxID=1469162 RepID=A0ABS2PWB7_9BACL|nr:gephyrin-like molybdotransferase Glp [Scopulibacillus daqui]MBM7644005.1 molybdopterin molybdotransferase [Scopulibacillus daqui]